MPNLDLAPKYFGFKTKKLGEEGPPVKLAFARSFHSLLFRQRRNRCHCVTPTLATLGGFKTKKLCEEGPAAKLAFASA